MDESIGILYFNWLYNQVSDPGFYNLLGLLHQKEFIFVISGDDNRAQDGIDLRTEFLHAYGLTDIYNELAGGCTVLEMLIAFSRRASFETDDSPAKWFWEMLFNLGLSEMSDATMISPELVHNVMEGLVWRNFDQHGNGGLFPLRHGSKNDQRNVEIWYQFNEYLMDRALI